jgi:hypothetical protein
MVRNCAIIEKELPDRRAALPAWREFLRPVSFYQRKEWMIMDLNYLIPQLQLAGWNKIGPNTHVGIPFDLVGEKSGLMKWNVLIKVLPVLDKSQSLIWQANFNAINNKSKSWFWGKGFVLGLIAELVAPDTMEMLRSDNFGLFGMFRLQGGGGRILVADYLSKQVYGQVPTLPVDAHMVTQGVKDALMRSLVQM